MRIGGNSADVSWYDPTSSKDKSKSCSASWSGNICVKYAIKNEDIQAPFEVAKNTNATYTEECRLYQVPTNKPKNL